MLTRSLHIANWTLVSYVRSLLTICCFGSVVTPPHSVHSGCVAAMCESWLTGMYRAVCVVNCSHNFTLKIPILKAVRGMYTTMCNVYTQQTRQRRWRRRRHTANKHIPCIAPFQIITNRHNECAKWINERESLWAERNFVATSRQEYRYRFTVGGVTFCFVCFCYVCRKCDY